MTGKHDTTAVAGSLEGPARSWLDEERMTARIRELLAASAGGLDENPRKGR